MPGCRGKKASSLLATDADDEERIERDWSGCSLRLLLKVERGGRCCEG